MLPVRELVSKFLIEQTNLIRNAIKNAGKNKVALFVRGTE